ncbi:MAG: hypothetical protein AAFP19_21250, partial [Bacteroidota bacterium]
MDLSALLSRLEQLEKRIEVLERENTDLRERLSKYEHPKTSWNSSLAPSTDAPYKKDQRLKSQRLRRKSNKNIGGQSGHRGSHLEMIAHPDEFVFHDVEHCKVCGKSLSKTLSEPSTT